MVKRTLQSEYKKKKNEMINDKFKNRKIKDGMAKRTASSSTQNNGNVHMNGHSKSD